MEITRWHLMRHAPVGEKRICGWLDAHAEIPEESHMAKIAASLPEAAGILTSDLIRSVETGDALHAHQPLWYAIGRDPGLREQHFGAWEGLSYDEASNKFPEESKAFWRDPANIAPPDGESFAQLCQRTANAMKAYEGENIICVCHAGVIRAALVLALGLTPERALAFEIAPLSLTLIDRIKTNDGDAWRISGVNLSA